MKPALWVLTLALVGCASAPNSIDVSGYPREMQVRYDLFTRKCSRCHGLDRPLQAHVGAKGWNDYVRRMSRHPGAGISEDDQREIAAFLQYHADRETDARRRP